MINLMQEVLRSGTGAGVDHEDSSCPRPQRPELLMTDGLRVHYETTMHCLGGL